MTVESAGGSTSSEPAQSSGRALDVDVNVTGTPRLAFVLDAGCATRCLVLHSIATFALRLMVAVLAPLSLPLAVAVLAPSRLRLRSPLWPASVRDDEIDFGSAWGFLAFALLWYSTSCSSKSCDGR